MLREVTEGDIEVFYAHQCDPDGCAMAGIPPRTCEGHRSHWQQLRADSAVVARAIEFENETVGNIVSFVTGDGEREVGYWIGKQYWGRGLATAALQELLDIVAERPLFARVAEHNVGSVRVLEKCRFTVVSKEPADERITEVILRLDAVS